MELDYSKVITPSGQVSVKDSADAKELAELVRIQREKQAATARDKPVHTEKPVGPAVAEQAKNWRPRRILTPAELEAAEQTNALRKLEGLAKSAHVARRYWNCSLQMPAPCILDDQGAEAYSRAQDLVAMALDAGGAIVALIGPRGRGKTAIACGAAMDAVRMRRTARVASVVKFYMDLKGTFKDDTRRTEDEVIEVYARPDLLVLDQMHRKPERDWHTTLLEELIDRRYSELRGTILVSNHRRDALEASLAETIMDRLGERGCIVECAWASLRAAPEGGEEIEISGETNPHPMI